MIPPLDLHRRPRNRCCAAAVLAAVLAIVAITVPTSATGAASVPGPADAADLADRAWVWPFTSFRIEQAFVAPANRYAPGHRGIDLRPTAGATVRSPAPGTVAFVGPVAGRGILTIDHGDGLVTTLEPIDTDLEQGTVLAGEDDVGTVAIGGHSAPGNLHFGVRLHGEYINPMLLLGGVPRAVLLPCC